MAKIIAMFNHKGGVSKTTSTFHLGWMLASKGKRVVMVDTDPQCNLTGLILGDRLDEFYENHPTQNIQAGLLPAFESQPRAISPVECLQVEGREGLFLLPGNVTLSEYEVTLGIAQELSGSIQTLKNLPGAFHYFANKVAEANSADYILLDMNPSLGAINQNFLMSSDCFIVPASPDFFSVMAIDSLAKILPRWAEWARRASASESLRDAAYPFPAPRLKFLGTIVQKYRPRLGAATVGFQAWIDRINGRVAQQLFPKLQSSGLTLPEDVYAEAGVQPQGGFCLAQIPDFNTLIATSQSHRVPVFALTDEMLGHVGNVLAQDKEKIAEFNNLFSILADRLIRLSENE